MKKDSETYATTDGSVSRTGRITEVTVQLNDNSGHYVFNKCTEFPTLLGVDWNVPLTLDVDFAAAYTIGDITVADNTVTVPVTENYLRHLTHKWQWHYMTKTAFLSVFRQRL